MITPCDCMVRQNSSGNTVCRRCNGDWYSCECSTTHTLSCPEFVAEAWGTDPDDFVQSYLEDYLVQTYENTSLRVHKEK